MAESRLRSQPRPGPKPLTEVLSRTETPALVFEDWGEMGVLEAQTRQDHSADAGKVTFTFVNHPPCLARGLDGSWDEIQATEAELAALGVGRVDLRRGGKLTYHGPGQTVLYALVPLRPLGLGPRDLVSLLLRGAETALRDLGVPVRAEISSDAGLYLGPLKVGSIGVAIKNGISRHGLSINRSVPREHISLLRWCGHDPLTVSSLEELGYPLSEASLRQSLTKSMRRMISPALPISISPSPISGSPISPSHHLSPSAPPLSLAPSPSPSLSGSPSYPAWLKKSLPQEGQRMQEVRTAISDNKLATICQEADCPNASDCFRQGHVSFLVLGKVCTRGCPFCAVAKGRPAAPDPEEPARLARAVKSLGLRRVVITMVDRDDLPDGGESHLVDCLKAVRAENPKTLVEMLTGDFRNCPQAPRALVEAGPDTFSHNIETVPRLYARVRPGADYRRSLNLLARVKAWMPSLTTKAAVMAGLGETRDELIQVMKDLRSVSCDRLVVGQYLPPRGEASPDPVILGPAYFAGIRESGLSMGFQHVEANPWARSSSHD